MNRNLYAGVAFILISGVMAGSAAVPMKYARRWTWENVWLLFNGLALVAIPLINLAINVPQAWEAYRSVTWTVLAGAVLLGLGWGIGSALCGISYTMLGVGLGMSVVLGLAAASGSVLPLLARFPGKLHTAEANALYWGIGVMLVWLILTARAGGLRQAARPPDETTSQADINAFGRGEMRKGLAVAIASGILSGLFNVGLVFGDPIRTAAIRLGAGPLAAVNALWLPVTAAGFVGILVQCAYRLTRKRAWGRYAAPKTASHWLLVLLMAALYTGSISLYGLGAVVAGDMGAVLGFPAYMSAMIITGNVAGALTGEWKGAPRLALLYGAGGLAALVAAIILVARANNALS
jgi:L-rhamnose-H+ transport protein